MEHSRFLLTSPPKAYHTGGIFFWPGQNASGAEDGFGTLANKYMLPVTAGVALSASNPECKT